MPSAPGYGNEGASRDRRRGGTRRLSGPLRGTHRRLPASMPDLSSGSYARRRANHSAIAATAHPRYLMNSDRSREPALLSITSRSREAPPRLAARAKPPVTASFLSTTSWQRYFSAPNRPQYLPTSVHRTDLIFVADQEVGINPHSVEVGGRFITIRF
jgi:hypothetical protein